MTFLERFTSASFLTPKGSVAFALLYLYCNGIYYHVLHGHASKTELDGKRLTADIERPVHVRVDEEPVFRTEQSPGGILLRSAPLRFFLRAPHRRPLFPKYASW